MRRLRPSRVTGRLGGAKVISCYAETRLAECLEFKDVKAKLISCHASISKIPAVSRFLSRPVIIRVPFFLILSFNKGTLKQKGQKGTTQEPRFRSDLGNTGLSARMDSRAPGLGFGL